MSNKENNVLTLFTQPFIQHSHSKKGVNAFSILYVLWDWSSPVSACGGRGSQCGTFLSANYSMSPLAVVSAPLAQCSLVRGNANG